MYLHIKENAINKIKAALPQAKINKNNFMELYDKNIKGFIGCYSNTLYIQDITKTENAILLELNLKEDLVTIYEL